MLHYVVASCRFVVCVGVFILLHVNVACVFLTVFHSILSLLKLLYLDQTEQQSLSSHCMYHKAW